MPTMNKEIKELWLNALRSGEYKQCRGRLMKETSEGQRSFCCLGVLTDLALKEGVIEHKWELEHNRIQMNYDYFVVNNEVGCLIPEVMKWAGIDTPDGTYYTGKNKISDELSTKNDRGASFKQIADIIERNF